MGNTSSRTSNSQLEEVPLQVNSHVIEIRGRQICKHVASDKVPKICIGPLYDSVTSASVTASTFEYILLKSPGESLQTYKAAVNNGILRTAKLSYKDDDGLIRRMTDDQFQKKMIHDGCYMLLESLHYLGYSLNYDEAFGRTYTPQSLEECFEYIFFPGNQICNVVLQKLLKQKFFKDIIETNEWREPSDIFRKVLYMFLLKPNLNVNHQVSCLDAIKTCISSCKEDVFVEEPSDVLHALHMLVVERRDSLYSNHGFPAIIDEPQIFLTATDLTSKGIRIKGVKNIGTREIKFESNWFGGILSMPVVAADEHAGLLAQVMIDYESTDSFTNEKREATSYFGLLKDLIPTVADTNILARKGVIEDNLILRNNFSATLKAMNCSVTCEQIKYVKLQVRDYSGMDWCKFLLILVHLIAVVGILQTVYNILQYYKKPNSAMHQD